MTRTRVAALFFAMLSGSTTLAAPDDFHAGTVIKDYGHVARVPAAQSLVRDVTFKVAFDVAKAAEKGSTNKQIESAARLLNMHADAGHPPANTRVAIVVHGGAAIDVTNDAKHAGNNASAGLIAQLIAAGATITLCGQTAAYYGIGADDLLPGVQMSLSAMTAHALLQQQGYTLNPF